MNQISNQIKQIWKRDNESNFCSTKLRHQYDQLCFFIDFSSHFTILRLSLFKWDQASYQCYLNCKSAYHFKLLPIDNPTGKVHIILEKSFFTELSVNSCLWRRISSVQNTLDGPDSYETFPGKSLIHLNPNRPKPKQIAEIAWLRKQPVYGSSANKSIS